jgi:hypothetical protein
MGKHGGVQAVMNDCSRWFGSLCVCVCVGGGDM